MKMFTRISAAILLSSGAAALAQPTATTTTSLPSSPTEVALIDHPDSGFMYNRFPTGERLYISDADPAGKSLCNSGCDSAWLPVIAPDNARPIGNWTIIRREDGRRQWALGGKPVYSRFHNLESDQPGWRLLSGDLARSLTLRR